uniref:FAM69 protein-kinase domain-containing protein n=1 Tax=Bubo bubo TaxID=30461 RepID=A0A8C0EGL1_BUBBB
NPPATFRRHGNVLHGQCYDRSEDPEIRVTAMLELGSPLEMIQLLQTPWEERFKICLSLVKLLFYLAHSPLGSIVLLDFQPRQFVMVDGNLKVTDMDDASTEELSCKEDNDCTLDFPTKSFPLKCSAVGKCEGINEKKNLFNAYRYFFTYLLPHSAPPALRPFLSDILNATGDLRYGINETLKAFEKVLHLYKSGLYLQKRPLLLKAEALGFRTVEGEDYKCWPSYSHLGCLLSVHGAEEAAAICNSQSQCQSFIVTQRRTWTGELEQIDRILPRGWSEPPLSKQCVPVTFAINSMGQGEPISSSKLVFLFPFQDAHSPRFRVA